MAFYFDRKLKIKIGRDYERMESTLVDERFKVSFSAVLSNDDTSNETFIEIYNCFFISFISPQSQNKMLPIEHR